MSYWIWKFGEYEIYHSLLLHNRRHQYGTWMPVMWKVYAPEPVISFRREVATEGGVFYIHACGEHSVRIDGARWLGVSEVELTPGQHTVEIAVTNSKTFPCLYVDGVIETDDSWEADDQSWNWEPVGFSEQFTDPEVTPEIFPFQYEKIAYEGRESCSGGVLFDFGRETFARVRIRGLQQKKVRVQYGESREEALSADWSVIHFEQEPVDGALSYIPYGFRYIYVSDPAAEVEAEYEYLPLEYRGEFCCNEEIVNKVWEMAAYTYHLNSREFLLDGIKRDRWVWGGDAYQSFFVNRYLFFDQDLERRTLIALAGRSPFREHINRIVDYTFYWFIGLYEYYQTYGDRKLLEQLAARMDEIMRFCLDRTDADGFMRGRDNDWIFIDWAPLDKTGALCGEQVLYAHAMLCYSKICALLGRSDHGCAEKAALLQEQILEKFYDPALHCFIDSYESGKRNVTRHCNLLAYLYLPCSAALKQEIYEHVILNDQVRQITTPYFKFYENRVHCEAGNLHLLEDSMRNYYGSMLAHGATTLYEEYDPTMTGSEHYAMYGNPYEKSLCHAWSASPIYLFGCYRMGVQNTGVAYDTFDVRPQLGDLKSFSGAVPVPGGKVYVTMDAAQVRVLSEIPGGTLWIGGRSYVLEAGVERVVTL